MMYIKLCVILCVVFTVAAQNETYDWDLAVAINDQVELLYSNGSLMGSAVQQFSKLKALTFDNIRHQFVVSDMDQQNDTIYSVHLTKETGITPIVQDLPDDIQGLAIDPVTDTLYWTNTVNRTINYVSLNDPLHLSKVLLEFDDKIPQDIAIDVCRRYIYWTNSDITNPTIERATLDGHKLEVLVNDDLFMPAGIAVDHIAQRIFWADKREGIYYRIESVRFDGTQREVLHEGTHQKPFGIAVDKEAVYWTDINNNALWKKKKRESLHPEKLRDFKENPMGLVTKHLNIQNVSECNIFKEAILDYNGTSMEYFEIVTDKKEVLECLNGGESVEGSCKCKRGFSGPHCEISCYNFCIHGTCRISSLGYPQCRCPIGVVGTRCQRNMCDGFCLNGGKCQHTKNNTLGVACQCKEGFIGKRCEKNLDPIELCGLFCKGKESDILVDQSNKFVCRCEQGAYRVLENAEELTANRLVSSNESLFRPGFIDYLRDPVFLIFAVLFVAMIVVTAVLSTMVCKNRNRPRIKKRIIVNKNVTPLTYRPQPTSQQCEITIENCCNMNVCETPCFEPPQLRGFQTSKKDEKKTLLANMENGEDMY